MQLQALGIEADLIMILNSLACATYTADAIRRHGAIPSLELSH